MNPKLTDQAVADLPIQAGRAELLEEIMSTPALDDTTRTAPPAERPEHRTRRWLVPLAVAATVAAVATGPAWWPHDAKSPAPAPQPVPPAAQQQAPAEATPGHIAVLDDPAWTVDNVEQEKYEGEEYGSISYRRGDSYLEVTWYPASSYADYVDDREHIVDPPAPGEPVEVLGLGGQLWAYSSDDHTVIREVQQGFWMEFRGGGLDEAAYLDLLGQLRMVDEQGFEQALPPEFVTDDERMPAVLRILDEIRNVSGEGMPQGADPISSTESDPYHLGADVAGAYACAWIDAFAAGDDRAVDVLATARDWPVLQRMDARGDYPEVLWDYADDVVAGDVPEGYEGGLGC